MYRGLQVATLLNVALACKSESMRTNAGRGMEMPSGEIFFLKPVLIIDPCFPSPVAPTGFPSTVMDTTTPRIAIVTWNAIECIDQNGIITNYMVQFLEQDGGASVARGVVDVNDRTYTVSGLTPATPYTFRVAGVTSGGTGPFSPFRMVITMDGRKLTITFQTVKMLS